MFFFKTKGMKMIRKNGIRGQRTKIWKEKFHRVFTISHVVISAWMSAVPCSLRKRAAKKAATTFTPTLYNTSNNPYTQQILQWWTSLTPGPHHAGLEAPLNVISMQWCRRPIYLMAISDRHEIGFTSTIYSSESICGPQAVTTSP